MINIVVPYYNVSKWIDKCVLSLKNQTYRDFRCVFIDDKSTDGSTGILKSHIEDDRRFSCVVNAEKKNALGNIMEGFRILRSSPEDILMVVDGDDWLSNVNVFQTVVDKYSQDSCLLTYGSFEEYPSGITHGYMRQPYSEDVILHSRYRDVPWKASHLRTFKQKVWDMIDPKDLSDHRTGRPYEVAWDLAMMYPMLEMVGSKQSCILDILYIYNKQNPISDMYIREKEQLETARIIKSLPRYPKRF